MRSSGAGATSSGSGAGATSSGSDAGASRRLRLLLSLLLAGALGAAAGPASAQERGQEGDQERGQVRGWEMELDGRYGTLVGAGYTSEEEGLGGHGVIRHAWDHGLSLGAGAGFTSYDFEGVAENLEVLDVFAEGRWRLAPAGVFSPFVAGRAGYTRLTRAGDVDDGLKLSLLGGAELWATEHLAFQAGVVASPFDLGDQDDFGDGVGLALQAGLVVAFQGRSAPEPAAPPPPADADGDGVPDDRDACPGTPGGVAVDAEGCPRDVDGDGVADHEDACPGTPEGARVDRRGCAIDADGDGVADGLDACPDTPRGAEVDAEGCPRDADGDGVPDGLDACPDTPAGEEVDAEGCTEIEAGIQRGRLVVGDVHFAFGSAELRAESRAVLDEVGRALLERTDVTVQVQGHTDSIGSERVNREMSWARARSVRGYLLESFPELDPERLVAVGMGETRPVADNATDEGRAQNRRVEFVVVEDTRPE